MKTLLISIFICCSLASFAQSVSLAELEQSRLMSRDSFVAFFESKGYENCQSEDDFGKNLSSSIKLNHSKNSESISFDTLQGGATFVRYFTDDFDIVCELEKETGGYKCVGRRELNYQQITYMYYLEFRENLNTGILVEMIDGYLRIELMPIDSEYYIQRKKTINIPIEELDSFDFNKSNRTNGDTSVINSHSGSGGGRCSDGGGLGYDKKMNGSGYKISNRIAIEIPKPTLLDDLEGIVVVTIWVDCSGNVIQSKAGAIGTTISNQELYIECEKKAVEARFSECLDCPEPQKGTITYFFVK